MPRSAARATKSTSSCRRTWAITVEACPRVVISDQNAIAWADTDHGRLVVKWSRARERFARLEASTRLLRTLADHGVPVAVPLVTRDGSVESGGPLGHFLDSVTALVAAPFARGLTQAAQDRRRVHRRARVGHRHDGDEAAGGRGARAGVIWQDGAAFAWPDSIRMNLALPHSRLVEAMERLRVHAFC